MSVHEMIQSMVQKIGMECGGYVWRTEGVGLNSVLTQDGVRSICMGGGPEECWRG